jgi:hypothetical protein
VSRVTDAIGIAHAAGLKVDEALVFLKADKLRPADEQLYLARRDLGRALSLVRAETNIRTLVDATRVNEDLHRKTIGGRA